MAVTYLRSANGSAGSGGTIPISLTGYSAGELFFASFEVYNQNSGTITPPSGGTVARRDECTQSNFWSKYTWWKILDSTDISGGSLSFSVPAFFTDYCYGGYSVSAGETLLDGTTYGTFAQGTGTAITAGSITSAPAGVLLALKTGWNSALTAGGFTGMTARQADYDTSNYYADEVISAGTTGTRSATAGVSDQWSVQLLAIGLAAGGAGPTISVQPSNAHKAIGATATFSVTAAASGGGSLSYQWKLGGVNVSTGSGGTTSSYTTAALAVTDDAGSYTCAVTETGGSNDGTTTSTAATLRVGIIYLGAGAPAYSAAAGGTVAPAYPTVSGGIAAGDQLVCFVAFKPPTASPNTGTVTTPTTGGTWNRPAEKTAANDGNTGGYTTTIGADTGNVGAFSFDLLATGGESGTMTITLGGAGTGSVAWAMMMAFRQPTGSSWSSVAGSTGKRTQNTTPSAGVVSEAMAADPGVTVGDYIAFMMGTPTDVDGGTTWSAQAITQSGMTYETAVETAEAFSGNGNDIGGFVAITRALTGTSAGVPTVGATKGGTTTNTRGPILFLRMRSTAATTTSDPIEPAWRRQQRVNAVYRL